MNSRSISALLLSATVLAASARADETSSITKAPPKQPSAIIATPIFSQTFVHGLPDGWKMVQSGKSPDGSTFVQGYVQEGQTPTNWSELVTVTGMKDMAKAPNSTLPTLLGYMAKQKRAACPERPIAISAGNMAFGSRPGLVAILGCGRLTADAAGIKAGEGEVGVYILVQGNNDYYIIQRIQRVPPFEVTPEPIARPEFSRLVQSLFPIGVCELADGPAECEPKLGGRK